MFGSVQIKQECTIVEDITHTSNTIVEDNSKYSSFINQNVNCKYQVPSYWDNNHVSNNYAVKNEIHIHQNMSQTEDTGTLMAPKDIPQHSLYCIDQPQEETSVQTQLNEQQRLTFPQESQKQYVQNNRTSRIELPSMTVQSMPVKNHRPGRRPKNSSDSSPEKKIKCQCEICFKEFGHKSNLFIHMRTHNGERPYKCSQCDKCFTHSGNLAIHMRTHSGERPYGCQICGKMFSHSGNLSTHLRTHSGVKPYKCNICGKEFRHSGNLSIHERIHSGIKPFQCKVCGKEFYHSGNLTTHMKKHSVTVNNTIDRRRDSRRQMLCSTNDFNEVAQLNELNNLPIVPMTNDIKLVNDTCNIVPTINECSNESMSDNSMLMTSATN